ncbi:reverse transcriptase domain-containing protein [Tanacetum coccineum]
MEKLVLALVHVSKRLKIYFQAHPIIVVTDQPIKNILSKPEVAADFIVERPEVEGQDDSTKEEEPLSTQWTLFTDRLSCVDGCGAGVILTDPEGAEFTKQVLVEELKEKSVNESEVLAVVEEEGESWMTPIHEYLTDKTLPAERKKARAIKQIHEGSCSMHAGTRFVVAKALRIGYYWPTMHKDARALINPITPPWPFYKWGIDIAGPFPEGPGKVKFLIVAMDYFTKWIEAKLVATITGNQVKKFVWENKELGIDHTG